jgi:hypothetical protein
MMQFRRPHHRNHPRRIDTVTPFYLHKSDFFGMFLEELREGTVQLPLLVQQVDHILGTQRIHFPTNVGAPERPNHQGVCSNVFGSWLFGTNSDGWQCRQHEAIKLACQDFATPLFPIHSASPTPSAIATFPQFPSYFALRQLHSWRRSCPDPAGSQSSGCSASTRF